VDGVECFRRQAGLDYALLHSHYWLSGLAALELRRRWNRPVIQMFHTLAALKNAAARSQAEREPEERVAAERRVASAADRLVAANPVERAQLARYCGADIERVRVIPCGVDLDLFQPADATAARARLGLAAERVLLFVGRLAPIKGVTTLLRALAVAKADGLRAADVRLVVVGGDKDGRWDGERARLARLAADLGVGAWVDFRGPQPQQTLPDYYAAADLCLMPSLYESFGMVALEAMACGVPVVGSRVGGLAVTVQDGVTGLLVPEGDAGALARAVVRLLGDEPRRRSLGTQAVEWAQQFGWPCIARAVTELYGELVPELRGAARLSRCPSLR
jgi:D-inositol-3-phosphate glycosyltransferase